MADTVGGKELALDWGFDTQGGAHRNLGGTPTKDPRYKPLGPSRTLAWSERF